MPQTKADSELQLMFAGPAPFFANAVLTAGILFFSDTADQILSLCKAFKYSLHKCTTKNGTN